MEHTFKSSRNTFNLFYFCLSPSRRFPIETSHMSVVRLHSGTIQTPSRVTYTPRCHLKLEEKN